MDGKWNKWLIAVLLPATLVRIAWEGLRTLARRALRKAR